MDADGLRRGRGMSRAVYALPVDRRYNPIFYNTFHKAGLVSVLLCGRSFPSE